MSIHRACYLRLFADEQGESHFEEIEVALTPVDFAPPAAPLHIATLFPATSCLFLAAPLDWEGTVPHPSPRRQLLCNLQGEYEITAGDGEVRRLPAGSVVLLEDTTGKGHTTRVIGVGDILLVAIALED